MDVDMICHVSSWRVTSIDPDWREGPMSNLIRLNVLRRRMIECNGNERSLPSNESLFGYLGRFFCGISGFFGHSNLLLASFPQFIGRSPQAISVEGQGTREDSQQDVGYPQVIEQLGQPFIIVS